MKINESYKEIQCIQKMTEEYQLRFYGIVEEYAPQLPQKIVLEGSAYTLHDFDHHCINIYKCISDIILNDRIAYCADGLSAKELYILNLAVLFHDIGMTTYLDGKRDNHSYLSAVKVEQLYNDEESYFAKNVNLTNGEKNALKAIIQAHSDVKDGSVGENENGLNNPKLTNRMQGKIRGKLLASILRLADEMDITEDRIGQTSIERNLKQIENKLIQIKKQKRAEDNNINEVTEIEISRLERLVESLAHWKRLHLFSEWRRENDSDEVNLIINDEYIEQSREDGETYESLAEDIASSYKKIKHELESGLKDKINSELHKLQLKNIIAIDKMVICTENKELETEIQNKLHDASLTSESINSNTHTEGQKLNESTNSSKEEYNLPEIVDRQFSEEFEKTVKKRHLIKVGHFILNDTYCARDWIDTKEIVETQSIMDRMVFEIVKHISAIFDTNSGSLLKKECLIVGLDLEGAVIAARVAMALQMAFSYIIPTKELPNNAKKEKEVQFEKCKKIVLITDAIVTYETINTSLEYIGINEKDYGKIMRIYTMFYRNSIYKPVEASKLLLRKTYCICDCFDIELFEKCRCKYNKDECFGQNI